MTKEVATRTCSAKIKLDCGSVDLAAKIAAEMDSCLQDVKVSTTFHINNFMGSLKAAIHGPIQAADWVGKQGNVGILLYGVSFVPCLAPLWML